MSRNSNIQGSISGDSEKNIQLPDAQKEAQDVSNELDTSIRSNKSFAQSVIDVIRKRASIQVDPDLLIAYIKAGIKAYHEQEKLPEQELSSIFKIFDIILKLGHPYEGIDQQVKANVLVMIIKALEYPEQGTSLSDLNQLMQSKLDVLKADVSLILKFSSIFELGFAQSEPLLQQFLFESMLIRLMLDNDVTPQEITPGNWDQSNLNPLLEFQDLELSQLKGLFLSEPNINLPESFRQKLLSSALQLRFDQAPIPFDDLEKNQMIDYLRDDQKQSLYRSFKQGLGDLTFEPVNIYLDQSSFSQNFDELLTRYNQLKARGEALGQTESWQKSIDRIGVLNTMQVEVKTIWGDNQVTVSLLQRLAGVLNNENCPEVYKQSLRHKYNRFGASIISMKMEELELWLAESNSRANNALPDGLKTALRQKLEEMQTTKKTIEGELQALTSAEISDFQGLIRFIEDLGSVVARAKSLNSSQGLAIDLGQNEALLDQLNSVDFKDDYQTILSKLRQLKLPLLSNLLNQVNLIESATFQSELDLNQEKERVIAIFMGCGEPVIQQLTKLYDQKLLLQKQNQAAALAASVSADISGLGNQAALAAPQEIADTSGPSVGESALVSNSDLEFNLLGGNMRVYTASASASAENLQLVKSSAPPADSSLNSQFLKVMQRIHEFQVKLAPRINTFESRIAELLEVFQSRTDQRELIQKLERIQKYLTSLEAGETPEVVASEDKSFFAIELKGCWESCTGKSESVSESDDDKIKKYSELLKELVLKAKQSARLNDAPRLSHLPFRLFAKSGPHPVPSLFPEDMLVLNQECLNAESELPGLSVNEASKQKLKNIINQYKSFWPGVQDQAEAALQKSLNEAKLDDSFDAVKEFLNTNKNQAADYADFAVTKNMYGQVSALASKAALTEDSAKAMLEKFLAFNYEGPVYVAASSQNDFDLAIAAAKALASDTSPKVIVSFGNQKREIEVEKADQTLSPP